jgi:hypothetical protein
LTVTIAPASRASATLFQVRFVYVVEDAADLTARQAQLPMMVTRTVGVA